MDLQAKIEKWKLLTIVQDTFPNTLDGLLLFAQTVISELIPGSPLLNRVQADILEYLQNGPQLRMIQAQRGQTKTALTAIFSAFKLIYSPELRVVIFSQNGKRAKEISGWVIKIFGRLEFLEFMAPDESKGDRKSIEAFEINYLLRGSDKSASVACQSIEAGAQGMRADLIIADDIESLQNSRSVIMREVLEENTKEFETINTVGEIIYLGTPQSVQSIYNNLPDRGYDVRIWPGRYPTEKEIEGYGPYLAPMIKEDIIKDPSLQSGNGIAGDQGKPTCPEMFDDDLLIQKQVSIGKAKFKLQYMLNTSLSDMERYPLKIQDLIVTSFSLLQGPVMPIWNSSKNSLVQGLPKPTNKSTDLWFAPIERVYEWQDYSRSVMYIDPSGGGANQDEMAYAIILILGNLVYLWDIGGVQGGYSEDSLMQLVEAAKRANCKKVYIEKNFGHGAHMSMLSPLFMEHHPVKLEEVYETGQKELRIIDVLEPLISSHRLIISPDVINKDFNSIQRYPTNIQRSYSLFHQLSSITRDRDCLKHDDRLDALAGAVRQIVEGISFSMNKQIDAAKTKAIKDHIKAWSSVKTRREMMTGNYAGPSKSWSRFG